MAVRYWPESSRQWGQAVLAEMAEISEPGAALRWSAGGILLFLRALVGHFLEWMRLPPGGRFSNGGLASGDPQFPKHPRFVTALILLGAAMLFFSPAGREAVSTVGASWGKFEVSPSDQRSLERLAAQAEKAKDARTLAFVALNHPDPKLALRFAQGAVGLDPNLIWVYATRFGSLGQGARAVLNEYPLDQLQRYDPNNAYIYLIRAEAEGQPLIEETLRGDTATRGGRIQVLVNDEKWVREMDRAYHASRYDSYYGRHNELTREGWRQTPSLSPTLIAVGMGAHRIPNAFLIYTYADLLIGQALQEGAGGHVEQGKEILSGVTEFGKRMTEQGQMEIEQIIGLSVTGRGLDGLKKLYSAAGREDEANRVTSQVQDLQLKSKSLMAFYHEEWLKGIQKYERRARLVQWSAIAALLLCLGVVLSLFALGAGAALSWQKSWTVTRLARRVADYGPLLFLITSVTFVLSFRPFAEVMEQYRSTVQSGAETRTFLWPLFVLDFVNPLDHFSGPQRQWVLWWVVLIVLAAIAMGIVVRHWLRDEEAKTTTR